jgi:DNA-directed RNA polymerase subunit H (RpoH/RPB5)
MESYQPALVYYNVLAMFENRGARPDAEPLPESELIRQMNNREYIMTSANRGPEDIRGAGTMVAVIVDENSRIAKATAQLEKIIALAAKQKKPGIGLEIILITQTVMQDRLMKREDLAPEGVFVSNHPYSIFLVNITKHVSSPKHEIVPEQEVAEFCARYHTAKEYFSKLPMSDPQAIWLGLRPGLVVRIIRASETAGEAPTYRICTRA